MKPNTKGMLLMLICPVVWSFSGLIAKYIPWPGLCIAGWRGLLSGLSIYIYMRITKVRPVFNWRSFIIALTVTGTLLCYFMALKIIPAANAVALQYTEPVFLLLLSAVFLKKKYRRADYLVVVMALLGVVLLFTTEEVRGGAWGSLLALLSGLCYGSTYFFMTDQPTSVRLSGMMLGNAMAFVGALTVDPRTLPINASILWIILLSGLFQISVPHIIMTHAMKLTSSLACSLIATLEMVLNPVWVYLFLGEVPSKRSILGCAVIMVSVVVWCVYSARSAAVAEAEGEAAQ